MDRDALIRGIEQSFSSMEVETPTAQGNSNSLRKKVKAGRLRKNARLQPYESVIFLSSPSSGDASTGKGNSISTRKEVKSGRLRKNARLKPYESVMFHSSPSLGEASTTKGKRGLSSKECKSVRQGKKMDLQCYESIIEGQSASSSPPESFDRSASLHPLGYFTLKVKKISSTEQLKDLLELPKNRQGLIDEKTRKAVQLMRECNAPYLASQF
jgi:hypothetical protein